MKQEYKKILLDAIAAQLKELTPGQAMTSSEIIEKSAAVQQIFYRYRYLDKDRKTVDYIRRLVKEVVAKPSFGCQHICSVIVTIRDGRRHEKAVRAWGNPEELTKRKVISQYDKRASRYIEIQYQKADVLNAEIQTELTETAIRKRKKKEESSQEV